MFQGSNHATLCNPGSAIGLFSSHHTRQAGLLPRSPLFSKFRNLMSLLQRLSSTSIPRPIACRKTNSSSTCTFRRR